MCAHAMAWNRVLQWRHSINLYSIKSLWLKLYMRIDFTHYKYHNNKLSPLFTFYDQSTYIYEQAIYVVASNSSHFNGQFRILSRFLFQKVLLSILSKMFLLFFSLDPLATTKHQISSVFVIVQFWRDQAVFSFFFSKWDNNMSSFELHLAFNKWFLVSSRSNVKNIWQKKYCHPIFACLLPNTH